MAGGSGRIALTYRRRGRTCAGRTRSVRWRVIGDQPPALMPSLRRSTTRCGPLPKRWTSISGAIDFCAGLLLGNGYTAARRVIDVSGDGASNDGRPVTEARDAAVAAGVTINGLPIIEVEPNLRGNTTGDNVIGGPDPFVVVAKDTAQLRRGRPAQVAGRGRRHSAPHRGLRRK